MPKLISRLVLMAAFAFTTVDVARGEEESLGEKIKKFFQATPTPTPLKKRHKTSTTKKKKEEVPASPSPSASPKPTATETPEPSVTPKSKKHHPSPAASPKPSASATPESSTAPKSKKAKKSPTPSPTRIPSPTATPGETPSPIPTETPSPAPSATPSPSPSATPSPSKKGAEVATVSPNEIEGFENYPSEVRKLISAGLDLTARKLDYTYGSADPANGGMDCSGFTYYVLRQSGVSDVPRDASQQYAWLRKAGKFQAVLSRSDDSFELDALKPGDLLFWTGTYNVERDPPVTHSMIYLGREKGSKRRIMVGASDGRIYKDKSRYGVSVFDFKISRPAVNGEGKLSPSFVGYGSIPGLGDR